MKTTHNHISIKKLNRRIEMDVSGGTFGTWHPTKLLTGYYWDALAAAPLFASKPVNHILLLGLGSGTVIRTINKLLPKAQITALEIDADIIDAAHKHFHLSEALNLKVIHCDAYKHLKRSKRKYDVVLDDIFIAGKGDTCRPEIDPQTSIKLIKLCLKRGGLAACNIFTDPDTRPYRIAYRNAYRQNFKSARALRVPKGDNEVIIGSNTLQTRRVISQKRLDFKQASDRKFWAAIKNTAL